MDKRIKAIVSLLEKHSGKKVVLQEQPNTPVKGFKEVPHPKSYNALKFAENPHMETASNGAICESDADYYKSLIADDKKRLKTATGGDAELIMQNLKHNQSKLKSLQGKVKGVDAETKEKLLAIKKVYSNYNTIFGLSYTSKKERQIARKELFKTIRKYEFKDWDAVKAWRDKVAPKFKFLSPN